MKLESGLINDVWKVKAASGYHIVKKINPISPHARKESTYKKIEALKKIFSDHDIPVVMAREINANELTFPYVKAKVLYSAMGPTSEEHAYIAGQLLGKIHSLNIRNFDEELHFNFLTDKNELLDLLEKSKSTDWFQEIDAKKFLEINARCVASMQKLSRNLLFSHCDFYPHNILWAEDTYYLIDWEFAGLINPGLEFVLGAMCFSQTKFKEGYFSTGATIEDDLEDCFWGAMNNGWVYWIVYNMRIALDDRFDGSTREKARSNSLEYYANLMRACKNICVTVTSNKAQVAP